MQCKNAANNGWIEYACCNDPGYTAGTTGHCYGYYLMCSWTSVPDNTYFSHTYSCYSCNENLEE